MSLLPLDPIFAVLRMTLSSLPHEAPSLQQFVANLKQLGWRLAPTNLRLCPPASNRVGFLLGISRYCPWDLPQAEELKQFRGFIDEQGLNREKIRRKRAAAAEAQMLKQSVS